MISKEDVFDDKAMIVFLIKEYEECVIENNALEDALTVKNRELELAIWVIVAFAATFVTMVMG